MTPVGTTRANAGPMIHPTDQRIARATPRRGGEVKEVGKGDLSRGRQDDVRKYWLLY
jgi:hypothetical protein